MKTPIRIPIEPTPAERLAKDIPSTVEQAQTILDVLLDVESFDRYNRQEGQG